MRTSRAVPQPEVRSPFPALAAEAFGAEDGAPGDTALGLVCNTAGSASKLLGLDVEE